jgi:hypothetical protein
MLFPLMPREADTRAKRNVAMYHDMSWAACTIRAGLHNQGSHACRSATALTSK